MKERARAIIVKDGAVLTIKRNKNNEIYWVFPGGGIETGEDAVRALIRECKEELGVDVMVGDLWQENFFVGPDNLEQKEYFYKCEIAGGELGTGEELNLEWLKLDTLEKYDLRPAAVARGLVDKK